MVRQRPPGQAPIGLKRAAAAATASHGHKQRRSCGASWPRCRSRAAAGTPHGRRSRRAVPTAPSAPAATVDAHRRRVGAARPPRAVLHRQRSTRSATRTSSTSWRCSRARASSPKSIRNYVGTLSALFNYARARSAAGWPPTRATASSYPGSPRRRDPVPRRGRMGGRAAPRPARRPTSRSTGRSTSPRSWPGCGTASCSRCAGVTSTGPPGGSVSGRTGSSASSTPRSRRAAPQRPDGRPARRRTRSALQGSSGSPGEDALVFADPITGEPLDKAAEPPPLPQGAQGRGARRGHDLHGLRHTFGTRMAAAGVPMRTLQEWMGHRDIRRPSAMRTMRRASTSRI